MAGLPHWDNSQAARNYYEPIFQNQFECIITPPAVITDNVDILVEQVISIDGLPEFFTPGTTTQGFKFAERAFAKATPETTLAHLSITFEVNLNESNNMYVYNTLRGWSDLIYDPANGRQGLKKDYVGEIYIAVFDKAGSIFRDYRFQPAFIEKAFNPIKLDYRTDEIYKMTAHFVADKTTETRVGQINI
jgi:hypothetical protein